MNFAINFDLFHLYHHQDQHHEKKGATPRCFPGGLTEHRKAFAFTSAFVRAAREDGSLVTIWWQMRHRKG